MQDVLQTLGITNWLLIVATKIWDIGWMLLMTNTGGNLIRTTSSTSAGFECKLNFVYIFCNLFTFHFFFTPVPNGARHFLAYRLDSTRLKMWSTKYLSEYWKFANYVALLDDNRWAKRILHWNPGGGRPGRPFFQWQTPLQNFCHWHHLGNWIDTAGSTDLWFQYYTGFISFCQR